MKRTIFIIFTILSEGLVAQDISSWTASDTLKDDSGKILHIEERGGEHRSLNYEYSKNERLEKEVFMTWKNNKQYERITEYHPNGTIRALYFWFIFDKTFFGKSSLDSTYTEFDLNGNQLYLIEYENNKINGKHTVFYSNGNIKSYTTFVNDIRNGLEVTYYLNGQIASELFYNEDRLISAKYYNSEGKEFENKEFNNGEGKLFFYEFGKPKGSCLFKKGKSKKCNCDCN